MISASRNAAIESDSSRRPPRSYIAISIALGLLLGIVLSEFAVRVSRYGADALIPSVMNSLHPIGTSGMIRASIEELGYELEPNLDRLYKKVAFRTNSAGLRDREYTKEKPEGAFRVAVIGDSFTMPTGVVIEEAYHSRIEASLNEAARANGSGQAYELINFGIGGYQLPQYLATLRDRALPYDPDLVLIGFSTNDYVFFQVVADKFKEPYRVKDTTYPFFASELVPWLKKRLSAEPDAGSPKAVLRPGFRAHVDEYFGRLAELARGADVPLVFVFLAQYRWQFIDLVDELAAIAANHGIPFVDASAPFPDAEDLSLRIFPADGHPNGEANRVFAEVIEAALLERDLVPAPAR